MRSTGRIVAERQRRGVSRLDPEGASTLRRDSRRDSTRPPGCSRDTPRFAAYLDSIPDDVFAGNSLIYRPAEKGYLLYSIGIDGKDSGGRTRADDPPGDDIVVQMPLPPVKK